MKIFIGIVMMIGALLAFNHNPAWGDIDMRMKSDYEDAWILHHPYRSITSYYSFKEARWWDFGCGVVLCVGFMLIPNRNKSGV